VACYQKVTPHLKRDINSSLMDWRVLLASRVSLHVKTVIPYQFPARLKLDNLSEDHIETSTHPQLESDVCLCALQPARKN
jgi:hypothetical protein